MGRSIRSFWIALMAAVCLFAGILAACNSPSNGAIPSTSAVVSLSPASLNLGSQLINTTSTPQSVTLSNTGNAALNISGVAFSGANASDFAAVSGTTCTGGGTVAAGGSCVVNITFTPKATGSRTATVAITDNEAGSPHTVALTGTGTAPAVSLAPASVDLGPQSLNTTSAPRGVTLSNTGDATLNISSLAVTGPDVTDFALDSSTTCTSSTALAPGGACSLMATFTPTAVGSRSAAITVIDNAAGSPHTLALTGTGVAPAPIVSLAPASLDFGGRNVSATSALQSVTISNMGDATLNISTVALTGANANDFAVVSSTTCTDNSSVVPFASCVLEVTFTPTATGSRTAELSITDDAADSPQTVPLTAIGAEPPIVPTQSGQVQGAVEGNLIAFRGIPFAAPPTGDLRWKPPTAPASWAGVRDASSWGNMCPQVNQFDPTQVLGNEDCLTLNIFRAYPPPTGIQPVIVSIHGGANRAGSGQLSPSGLVAKGVIVVTVQYRLGLVGFLAHSLLTAEGGGSSGNYGLMDQIAALQWVKTNIAAFGGDPSRIMISGGSAGAVDVQALLAAPAAQGLFTRAEMSSEGLEAGDVLNLNDSAAYYQSYVGSLGCDNAADVLACLRAKTAEDVVNALQIPTQSGLSTDRITLRLTLEPNALPVDPFVTLRDNGSPVPLIIGSNREDNLVCDGCNPVFTDADYLTRLHLQFDSVNPGAADQVHSLYPPVIPEYSGPFWALVAVHSDYYITCKVCQIARVASGAQRPPVWRYLFTHTVENPAGWWSFARAFHGLQYVFLFTNLDFSPAGPYTPTDAERQLADQMQGYWARFADTGDPNGGSAVQWLRYDAQSEPILQLDDTIVPINGYHKDQCDYFATLPPPPL